ncbi:hypothetical protein CFOL_v3_34796 [Cephalotus follicularis]|uniref:Uncharacterized protein n=1 Tax=Cephalotus follicularis TaxID=3775 RepID=A0A1Q3DG24_CEPFO|nr:hypothetical protein CFOL_v3_34796 [Cephalotus follicularis]
MQDMFDQRMDQNRSPFQGQLEAFTPERENLYPTSKAEGQWRWERDGPKVSNPMPSQMFIEGQCVDASKSFFQGQRPDFKPAVKKQNNDDPKSRPHEQNIQCLEGLQQKFLNDIVKLAKNQNDVEDAEIAGHREKINAINAQYQEQLASLRSRHASRRDEFLHKEEHERQHKYQQAMMDHYPKSGMVASDPHGYASVAAPVAGHFDSYREQARFIGAARDHGFEQRGPYPGGRVYDTGSHY